jgi:TolB-like protein
VRHSNQEQNVKSSRVKLLKAKLISARADERLWAKVYNRAERAMLRIGRQIEDLERRIANELAKTK